MIKKRLKILPLVGIILLVLLGKYTARGMKSGLELCLQSVIPSLFPFLVLSKVVVAASGEFSGKLPARAFHSTGGASPLLTVALLGGYPVGACTLEQTVNSGRVQREDAAKMLAYCNMAGPAFLFGIAAALFPSIVHALLIWAIQIISGAVLAGILGKTQVLPGNAKQKEKSDALQSAVRTMAAVCAWIVLTKAVLAPAEELLFPYLPKSVCNLFSLLPELTTGVLRLKSISSCGVRFILSSILLSFGGFCVWLQIFSVTPHVSKKYFAMGTLFKTACSAFLSAAAAAILFPDTPPKIYLPFLLAGLGIALGTAAILRRKNSGNSGGNIV